MLYEESQVPKPPPLPRTHGTGCDSALSHNPSHSWKPSTKKLRALLRWLRNAASTGSVQLQTGASSKSVVACKRSCSCGYWSCSQQNALHIRPSFPSSLSPKYCSLKLGSSSMWVPHMKWESQVFAGQEFSPGPKVEALGPIPTANDHRLESRESL